MQRHTRRARIALAAMLGATLMQGCGDAPTQAKARPGQPSLNCSAATTATFTYYDDANLTTGASLNSGTMYVGQVKWVKIQVRDGNCYLPPSQIGQLTTSSPGMVEIQVANSSAPSYRLRALSATSLSAQLSVTAIGKTFTSTLFVNRPTIRLVNAAGQVLSNPINVEAGSSIPIGARAYAGSTGPQISTTGWPSGGATWTTASSAIATVANGGINHNDATALASLNGVATGNTTVSVQLLGETVTNYVNVAVKAPVASVTVSGPATLAQGQTGQFTASARDAGNNVLTGRPVSWSSSNTGVVTVNSAGVVTVVAPGTVSIIATVEGVQGSATLQASGPPPVATVSVSGPMSLDAGNSGQFQAVLRDAGNNVLTGRTVTWSSSNTAVATVNGSGLVTAVAAGLVQIHATSEGVQGTADLQVNPPYQEPGIHLTVTYPGGVPTLNWTTTYEDAHDVYILREEQLQSPWGDSYSETLEYVGTTTSTSFQHTAESYTGETAWNCGVSDGDGGWWTVRKHYIIVLQSSPSITSARERSRTIDIGGSCWS